MNPEKRALKASRAISEVRKHHKFTYNELEMLLRKAKCPYATSVISILIKSGIINKHQGLYSFVSNKPVYYGLLKPGLKKASESTKISRLTFLKKHMGSEMLELYEEKISKNNHQLLIK
jgi:hypothetical protein